ncbi:MAG: hypothetical protein GQ576_06285 [Methanococcoides sp.]|nr:hypothetical protein [Methanococcoides sp.]
MVCRRDLNSKGYVTGMKVFCNICHKRKLEGRAKPGRKPTGKSVHPGRTMAEIKEQTTMETMGVRMLSQAETDELSKQYLPPMSSKEKQQRAHMWIG